MIRILVFAAVAFASAPPAAAQSVEWVAWAERQPTPEEQLATYPSDALENEIEGEARLICTVLPDRTLDCAVHSETPADAGFGAAALKLARLYVVRPAEEDPRVAVGQRLLIPIEYRLD